MEKRLLYIIAGTSLFFSMMSGCMSCRTYTNSNKISAEHKNVNDSLIKVISNLKDYSYTKKELDLLLERTMYQTSKEVVYSNNAIVRTTTRPDDVIRGYDDNIKRINDELKKIR